MIYSFLSKIDSLLKISSQKKQKKLFFQNPKNNIHPSFVFGFHNVVEIAPSAVLNFEENTSLHHNNFITILDGAEFSIGKNSYITRSTIAVLEKVEIGENCILGEGLKIFDHNHQYQKEPFKVEKYKFNTAPVKIGNNLWTGANCIILKGVTIGNNVILGAGCVIHKDIPDNTIVINKQDQLHISINGN